MLSACCVFIIFLFPCYVGLVIDFWVSAAMSFVLPVFQQHGFQTINRAASFVIKAMMGKYFLDYGVTIDSISHLEKHPS